MTKLSSVYISDAVKSKRQGAGRIGERRGELILRYLRLRDTNHRHHYTTVTRVQPSVMVVPCRRRGDVLLFLSFLVVNSVSLSAATTGRARRWAQHGVVQADPTSALQAHHR